MLEHLWRVTLGLSARDGSITHWSEVLRVAVKQSSVAARMAKALIEEREGPGGAAVSVDGIEYMGQVLIV